MYQKHGSRCTGQFLRGICGAIETFARKHNLIEYRKEYIEYGKKVYSADFIHNWIAVQFDNLMTEWNEKDFSHYSQKVREAMKYIHNYYGKNIKIEDIAGHIGVSGDYLRHLFKEETGKGINEYLTELRMEKAKGLLLEKKYKLYEIAEMVGYQSGTYFSSAFRKITGIKPQQYEEQKSE